MQAYPVVTTSGRKGRVFRKARFLDRSDTNRIEFDDGAELRVPPAALVVQPDGSFLLDDAEQGSPSRQEPQPEPRDEPRAAGADLTPAIPNQTEEQVMQTMADNNSQPITFSDPLFTEKVHVENVPVNRLVDGPVQVRQEGDVTIIPVVEEVITVQKRLLLKEEIRITRSRTEVREPRRLVLGDSSLRTLGADGREIEVHE
ncbi:MAG TPA: DUF2382 domain-containing protein [Bryobacteraceae bacterium]|nr:DUF2382 domain-containing protein [Bryobacteraceae bacterium]